MRGLRNWDLYRLFCSPLCGCPEYDVNKGREERVCEGVGDRQGQVEVSHLQFADDTIFFLEHDNHSVTRAFTLIQIYWYISRLKMNLGKS